MIWAQVLARTTLRRTQRYVGNSKPGSQSSVHPHRASPSCIPTVHPHRASPLCIPTRIPSRQWQRRYLEALLAAARRPDLTEMRSRMKASARSRFNWAAVAVQWGTLFGIPREALAAVGRSGGPEGVRAGRREGVRTKGREGGRTKGQEGVKTKGREGERTEGREGGRTKGREGERTEG